MLGVESLETKYASTHEFARKTGYQVRYAAPETQDPLSKYNYKQVGLTDASRDIVTINCITKHEALISQAIRILKRDGLLLITLEENDLEWGLKDHILRRLQKEGFETIYLNHVLHGYPLSREYQEGAMLIAWRANQSSMPGLISPDMVEHSV